MQNNLISRSTLPFLVGVPVVALIAIVGLILKPTTKAATVATPPPAVGSSAVNSDSGFHLHHTDLQYRDRKLQFRK